MQLWHSPWAIIKHEELTLKLYNVIWRHKFVEKIADKHGVTADEVEEILFSCHHFRLVEKGQVKGENLYGIPSKSEGNSEKWKYTESSMMVLVLSSDKR